MVEQFILNVYGGDYDNDFSEISKVAFSSEEEALKQKLDFVKKVLGKVYSDQPEIQNIKESDLEYSGYDEGYRFDWNNISVVVKAVPVMIQDADKVGDVSLLVLTSTLREKYAKVISERLKSCQMFAMQFDAHSCYEKSIEIMDIGVLEEVKLDSKEHVVIVISSSAYHIGDLNMAQLSQIFEVIKNRQPRYMWTAKSNDGSYDVTSDENFATRKECYENMRRAALMKAEWNTEWEDFGEPDEDSCIGYDFEFQRDRIVHTSYSGTYTYQIVPC